MEFSFNGKPISELNEQEVLEAMEQVAKRLHKGTGDPRYKRIAAFARGAKVGIENDLDETDSAILGLASVEIAEGRDPDKFFDNLMEEAEKNDAPSDNQ